MMMPSSGNVSGGMTSSPRKADGPWPMEQPYARDDIGTSSARVETISSADPRCECIPPSDPRTEIR